MFLYETITWLCKRITNMTMCTFWWKCHVMLIVKCTFSNNHTNFVQFTLKTKRHKSSWHLRMFTGMQDTINDSKGSDNVNQVIIEIKQKL